MTPLRLLLPRPEPGHWALALKNVFLPIFCNECGNRLLTEDNGYFCPGCWEASPRIGRPRCTSCGRPHEAMVGFGSQANFPCASCREKPNPHVRAIFGAAYFEGAFETAIKLLKFHGKQRLAPPLGEVLREFAAKEMDLPRYELVTPVPLHRVRLRARGYNQSLLLAEEVVRLFPNARLDQSLQRIRPTRTQSRLRGKERRSNVRGAFAVVGEALRAEHVLLVDDVVTSGGTVTECARALKRGGAREVDVLTVALAMPRRELVDLAV